MPDSVPSADELRDALRAQGAQLPKEERRLGEALWGDPSNPAAHAACLADLPTYVQAEVAGENPAARFPDVKRHLEVCDSCAFEYADLLDAALAERQGRFAPTLSDAQPDFSFLASAPPTPAELLQVRVTDWTRAILAALAPAELPHLPSIADAFFAQLDASTSPRTYVRVVREETATYGSPLVAPQLLSATYATIKTVTQDVSRTRYADWLAQNSCAAELDARARHAAEELGMNRAAAEQFGRAFAEQIISAPAALEELLSRS